MVRIICIKGVHLMSLRKIVHAEAKEMIKEKAAGAKESIQETGSGLADKGRGKLFNIPNTNGVFLSLSIILTFRIQRRSRKSGSRSGRNFKRNPR